jgi:uncharacterized protein CbrC (UPF0167 family)
LPLFFEGATMSDDQPYFRFNPVAYRHEFEGSEDRCDVCLRPSVWKYKGVIYTAAESPMVCARCIADGGLAAFFGDESFQLHDGELDHADPALEDEVLRRTPGVACFNGFAWPVLDGRPLAFVGYGEDEALIALPEVQAAIGDAFEPLGWTFDGPSPYALVFRELDGPRYRAVVDLD